jgi:uridylate kinase
MPRSASTAARPVVLSVGGSVLVTGRDDLDYLTRLAALIGRVGRGRTLVVTTGGGRVAREYIDLGRSLGLTEVELDEIGIDVTRLHARLLAAKVGPPAPVHIPTTISSAVQEAHRNSPVVLGGTEPGHTTDGVAAMIAVRLRAERVVNATAVDGVYDRDPARDAQARRHDRMSWEAFRAMIHSQTTSTAGQRFVFDQLGANVLAGARIPLLVVDGRELENLEKAIEGQPFDGSVIS